MLEDVSGVLIDFVGTLVTFKVDRETAFRNMYEELAKLGMRVKFEDFRREYDKSASKYRKIRYEQLIEVSNEVWISEALKELGFGGATESVSSRLADTYFESFLVAPEMIPDAKQTLEYLSGKGYRLSLVSNFTYAPFPERLLKQFGLAGYFSSFAISHRVGYRKPHPAIFEHTLKEIGVSPAQAVMVGDTPTEDIYGAKKLGMKAIQVREHRDDAYIPYAVGADQARYLEPDRKIASFADLTGLL